VNWRPALDSDHPCWSGYRDKLHALPGNTFPTPPELSGLLSPGTINAHGKPIRFVASSVLPEEDYESRIYRTGEVSTRSKNVHDLFNALAWAVFPRCKSALNALHHTHRESGHRGSRGRARDALTLFDEGGAIVLATETPRLEAIARHDWPAAFSGGEPVWRTDVRVMLLGHGLLEKCLSPYKSMTANALLLQIPRQWMCLDGAKLGLRVDEVTAALLLNGEALASPAGLSPLPLMGIPGWWPGEQDVAFYADSEVFRPRPAGRPVAPVHRAGVA